MRYIRIQLDIPPAFQHPMQEFVGESSAVDREELLTWNLHRERDIEFALFYVDGDIDPYRDAIAGVESIPEFTLTPIDEESFYSYVCQETRKGDAIWREEFADLDLVVMPPVVYDSQGRTNLTVVGTESALSSLVENLENGPGVGVDVLELGEFDRRHATIGGQLTDRQLELVETASELGYYEVPRDASLEDVADVADVARSTASTVLRRAESSVMGTLAGQ